MCLVNNKVCVIKKTKQTFFYKLEPFVVLVDVVHNEIVSLREE